MRSSRPLHTRKAFRDLRPFLRELTLRHEHAFAAVQASLDALLEQSARHTEAIEAACREIVSERRAQRQALFRILGRLPKGGQAGAAAPT